MVGGKSGCFLKIGPINETAGKTAGIVNQIIKLGIFVIKSLSCHKYLEMVTFLQNLMVPGKGHLYVSFSFRPKKAISWVGDEVCKILKRAFLPNAPIAKGEI